MQHRVGRSGLRACTYAWVATWVLSGLLAGCGSTGPRASRDVPHEPSSDTAPRAAPAPPGVNELPAEVPTRPLHATPIHIGLADLPEPFATESARRGPEWIEPPTDAALDVPQGFVVQRFATHVPMARWLAVTPDGRVLVAQSREDHITVLEDADGDGVAESRGTFANEDNGLNIPFGMAFTDGAFFLGNQDEVRRYRWQRGQARLRDRGERVTALPGGGYRQHWTRNVVLDADGQHLFVSVGSRSNVEPEAPPRAAILRMRLDGTDREVFASGLRNPVGLAVHPDTGALHASVNERDLLGDGLVPDYFTRVRRGEFFGWPYAYLHPSNLDPRRSEGGRSERPDLVRQTRTPDVLFEAHSAALGTTFLRQDAFPEPYRSGAFVAMRGSWNRSRGTGYQIVFIPFQDNRPVGHYLPFVTGFLVDPAGPTTWGRPVGLVEMPDGALLFTDEPGGVVYRVSWSRPHG